jgi:hypothetical protein
LTKFYSAIAMAGVEVVGYYPCWSGRPRLPAVILQPSALPKKPRPDFVGTVLFVRSRRRTSSPRSRTNKTRSFRCGLLVGRDDKIRTCDPLHPMQVRYRAALRPEIYHSAGCKGNKKMNSFILKALTFF